MKLQKRNLVEIWYALYQGESDVLDSDGYETGQKEIIYSSPVSIHCSVSAATGQNQIETFGNLESYDKVIVTDDISCPIDENSILFIDNQPDNNGKNFDYVVKRIAKSLNFIAYAVSKVKVTT